MKKLISVFTFVLYSLLVFAGSYVLSMLIGSIVAWENLFVTDSAFKFLATFFSIVFTIIAILYYAVED